MNMIGEKKSINLGNSISLDKFNITMALLNTYYGKNPTIFFDEETINGDFSMKQKDS